MTVANSDLFTSLPKTPHPSAISPQRLHTLQDLINVVELLEDPKSPVTAMLSSLAGHICLYFDKAPQYIEISRLTNLRPRLRTYLEERGLKPNSIKAYVNFLRILLQKAKRAGWRQSPSEIEDRWRGVFAAVAHVPGCRGIVDFAIRNEREPADFADKDLDSWADEQLRFGRQYEYIRHMKRMFRRCVAQHGLGAQLPKITFQDPIHYGVGLSRLPEPLQTQVKSILKWKTAPFAVGRPISSRHRDTSAHSLQQFLSRLFGFVQKYIGTEAHTLVELLCEENVNRFTEWCINERKVSSQSLARCLSMIPPLGRHPLLREKSFAWVRELAGGLPLDRENERQERKARKWAAYDKLSEVPGLIRRFAQRAKDRKHEALLVRDALLIQWMLVLPWRQSNVRQCRIVTSQNQRPNLEFEEIPALAKVSKPSWVEDSLKINPHQPFWQYRFEGDETKNGHPVHAILPKQLIEPLEVYLSRSRPMLLDGEDSGFLFLNDHGQPFSHGNIRSLIGRITLKYVGRRVTPHIFRDIFAVQYLADRPEDYLTLSKILWHRNIQTTLQIYGAGFDESHGARRTEEWLEARTVARQHEKTESQEGRRTAPEKRQVERAIGIAVPEGNHSRAESVLYKEQLDKKPAKSLPTSMQLFLLR
jgi:integrase